MSGDRRRTGGEISPFVPRRSWYSIGWACVDWFGHIQRVGCAWVTWFRASCVLYRNVLPGGKSAAAYRVADLGLVGVQCVA